MLPLAPCTQLIDVEEAIAQPDRELKVRPFREERGVEICQRVDYRGLRVANIQTNY